MDLSGLKKIPDCFQIVSHFFPDSCVLFVTIKFEKVEEDDLHIGFYPFGHECCGTEY